MGVCYHSAAPSDSPLLFIDFYENYVFSEAYRWELISAGGGAGDSGKAIRKSFMESFKRGNPSLQLPVYVAILLEK